MIYCIQNRFDEWFKRRNDRPSCDDISSFGFNAHLTCMVQPTGQVSSGICYQSGDWTTIFQLAGKGTVSVDNRLVAWTQLWDITKNCPQVYNTKLFEVIIRTSVSVTLQYISSLLDGISVRLNIPRAYLDYLSYRGNTKRAGGEVVISVIDVEQAGTAARITTAASDGTLNSLSVTSADRCNEPCYHYNGSAALNSIVGLFGALLVSLHLMA